MTNNTDSKSMTVDYCILGGGMVGGAAALGLAKLGYTVAVIESQQPISFDPQALPDLRVSALNRFTQNLLTDLDVWDDILAMRSKRYHKLSVWEQSSKRDANALHFEASEVGESYLGYFVENRILQLALLNKLRDDFPTQVSIHFRKAQNIDIGKANSPATVTLENGEKIQAKSVIAADGGFSQLRSIANIGTTGWQYEQKANVFLVKMHDDFDAATWQEFTAQGPLAFLPLFGGYASLVWYAGQAVSESLANTSIENCKPMIVDAFPSLLGDFDVVSKTSFGLRRMHANNYWRGNVVLLGDAAHQINPLAGQGVNLGFKDVAALLESIKNSPISSTNKEAFADYETKRRGANLLMMTAMDGFYATFSNEIAPLKVLRSLGIKVANSAGPIKHRVLKYAMGID
jgi:2-octaprenyl-3-methyl-6-methoxy-1,4-benzoquinol hydroxylase